MKELVVAAEKDNLDTVIRFIGEILEEQDCPPKIQMQIELAVEEIFINIASYAYYPETGNAVVRAETDDEHIMSITFIDSGIPYDPLEKKDPDISLAADERQIGGLGIYLVKKNMDNVSYEYRDGRNILMIRKKLGN